MIQTLSSTAIFMLAQAPPATVDTAVQVTSIWDFILKGGVMMIPIGLCSLVTIAVAADRAISLRTSAVIPPTFLPGLKKKLDESADDPAASLAYCKKHDSPVARVFSAGVKRLGLPLEILERHIAEAGERELFKLRKNMRALSIIAAISPLLGLLGTIFGMIAAFQTVAVSGDALGRTELLASGIYEALITTAAGLIVALPALIMYHWLSAKIDKLINEIDLLTLDFIESHALPAARPVRSSVFADNGASAGVGVEAASV
jgi:biopolymer transport protein ExbB